MKILLAVYAVSTIALILLGIEDAMYYRRHRSPDPKEILVANK